MTPSATPSGHAQVNIAHRKFDSTLLSYGSMLIVLFALISYISPFLQKDRVTSLLLLSIFIGCYICAGGIFLLCLRRVIKKFAFVNFWVILCVGLFMRLFMLISEPILENDYFRYMWDGALTATGNNPYRYSPLAIAEGEINSPDLQRLAVEGSDALTHINHPHIKTIYPPVAQGIFAIAYRLAPFDTIGLRNVFLLFDGATLALLALMLARWKKNPVLLLAYWWNPLIVKEIFNSVHMDVLLFPFILAALLFTVRKQFIPAFLAIAIAVGIKVWPIFLVAFVFIHVLHTHPSARIRLKILLPATLLLLCIFLLLLWPILAGGLDDSSGFIKYSQSWRNNDCVFRLLLYPVKVILTQVGDRGLAAYAFTITKYACAAVFLTLLIQIMRRWKPNRDYIETAWVVSIAALYLLSPTQFPWYAAWFMPLLVLRNWPPLYLYVLLLPIYYLQHWLGQTGNQWWFDNVVVWVEHAPVLTAIIYWYKKGPDCPLREVIKKDAHA